jgi:hypothetical protein
MNRARAKEILGGYRPHKDLAADPEFAPALALLEQDAELARWFEHEQALDAALQRKLQEIPIPAQLLTRILASRPKRLTRPDWWREPSLLLAAAAVLVVIGVSAVWLAPWKPSTWSDYQAKMVGEVTKPYDLDITTRSHDQVRQRMAAAGYPSDYRVPPGLLEYPLEGGLKLRWYGHRISVVCFGSDEERKPDVWLIVSSRTSLSGAPAGATPEFGVIGRSRIASWADDGHFYIVATRDGPDLRGLF